MIVMLLTLGMMMLCWEIAGMWDDNDPDGFA